MTEMKELMDEAIASIDEELVVSLSVDERMDALIQEVFVKQPPRPEEPEFNQKDNIIGWFGKYIPLYAALGFKYDLKYNETDVSITCGKSHLTLDIPEGLECYNQFIRLAVQKVSMQEQARLA